MCEAWHAFPAWCFRFSVPCDAVLQSAPADLLQRGGLRVVPRSAGRSGGQGSDGDLALLPDADVHPVVAPSDAGDRGKPWRTRIAAIQPFNARHRRTPQAMLMHGGHCGNWRQVGGRLVQPTRLQNSRPRPAAPSLRKSVARSLRKRRFSKLAP